MGTIDYKLAITAYNHTSMLNNPFSSRVSISSNYLRDSAASKVLSNRSMTEL